MCYHFLNYLLSGHFLNKTVDVFKKKIKKKRFMQGDFNLQSFTMYSEEPVLLVYTFRTNLLILSE